MALGAASIHRACDAVDSFASETVGSVALLVWKRPSGRHSFSECARDWARRRA